MNDLTIDKEKHFLCFNCLNNDKVSNLFSLKPYDFNAKHKTEEELVEQYNELLKNLDTNIIKWIKPHQTHTNRVEVVNDDTKDNDFEEVDGLITNLKNIALVTSLADCQGLIIYDEEHEAIGNIHSGWKGTLNRIIDVAINKMISEYNSDSEKLVVCIFPSILKCSFEVDEDVMLMFKNEFQDINVDDLISEGEIKEGKQKYYIDTVEINVRVLEKLGVKNINKSNMCTVCNNNMFNSHRGDEEDGRNVGVIVLK